MERLTTYHGDVAVIKDKNRLSDAMAKLAAYEDWEEKNYQMYRIVKIRDTIDLGIAHYCIIRDTISANDVIGKTIFLTHEDAEKSVEEMKCAQARQVSDALENVIGKNIDSEVEV